MSGGEGHPIVSQNLDQIGITDQDLDEYAHYSPDGKALKGAKLNANGREDNNWVNPSGANVTGLLNGFMAWKDRRNKVNEEHEKMVAAVKDRPGRQATILTPYDEKQAQTLLGGGSTAGKTLLG